MISVECPKPAYERIVKSGLDGKILGSHERITDIILGPYLESETYHDLLKEAKDHLANERGKITEKNAIYKDILKADSRARESFSIDKEELLIEFPGILAYAALGDEVFSYRDYGFSDMRQLAESVASFCLGKETRIMRGIENDHYWRYKKYKNRLSNSNHGDCYFSQTDVSGEDYEASTLFGKEEVFDTWKDVMAYLKGVYADYSYWQTFLTVALLYARAIGKHKMPEITSWRNILEDMGFSGIHSAESMLGTRVSRLEIEEKCILIEGEKPRSNIPILIYSNEKNYHPYVSDNKLFYIKEDPEGKMELQFESRFIEGKRFSPHIVYEEDELPEILKGTYRLFARDRRLLPQIMDAFLSERKHI